MAKVTATVQNLTKFLKDLGISSTENKTGYFIAPKTATGKEFIIFLPEKNRNNIQYTKKSRSDFLKNELLPALYNFNGAKYELIPKNSTAGQISFSGSQIYIIPKLIAMKGAGASQGAAFEYDLEKDFNSLISEKNVFIYPKFMKEFEEKVLKGEKVISVEVTGKENTPRPLKFDSKGLYCSLRGGPRTTDIGEGLADVKVVAKTKNGQSKTYDLSAKFGNTVTFFNSGLGSGTFPPSGAFPPDEFASGSFQDKRGLAILDMFGLDPKRFRDVFVNYKEKTGVIKSAAPKAKETVVLSSKRKTQLEEFLKTVIGENYYLLHLDNKKEVHMFHMTKSFLEKASKIITDLTIEYPVGGSAKRVDIKLETELYELNFNIRSKQAGITYPTHIMCDYKFKH